MEAGDATGNGKRPPRPGGDHRWIAAGPGGPGLWPSAQARVCRRTDLSRGGQIRLSRGPAGVLAGHHRVRHLGVKPHRRPFRWTGRAA